MLLDTTYSPSILTFGPLNPPQNRNHIHSHIMSVLWYICQNGLLINEYASLLCKPTLTRKSRTLWPEQLSIKTNYVVNIGSVGGGWGSCSKQYVLALSIYLIRNLLQVFQNLLGLFVCTSLLFKINYIH